MSFKNVMKVVASLAMLAILAGCTITGEPRMSNVAFDEEGYIVQNENFKNAISVGEVSEFPGTSHFTYGGKIAPNFSNESFAETLSQSLKNSKLYGDKYSLDAKLIDSGDWTDIGITWGPASRRIEIEYTLKENSDVIFKEKLVSDIPVDFSQIAPYYLEQRKVAEINYADNIKLLIEKINNL